MSSYERPQMWFFTAEELDAIAGGASNRSGDIGTSVETKLVNFENRIINVGVIGVEDNTLGNALANALAEKMLREDRINLLLQSLGSIALSNENSYELYHLLGNQVMPFVFETMTDFWKPKTGW